MLDGFAAVMVCVSLYCAARLLVVKRLGRSLHYDVNLAHVAMGTAMAGMLWPRLHTLSDHLWEGIFSALAARFAWRSWRLTRTVGWKGLSSDRIHGISHYLTHLAMSCSMLYMFLAARTAAPGSTAPMAMDPAPGTADFVALPFLFVVVVCASAVWHVDSLSRFSGRLVSATASGGAGAASMPVEVDRPGAPWLAPRDEMGCHIAMCVAMAVMLVLLL